MVVSRVAFWFWQMALPEMEKRDGFEGTVKYTRRVTEPAAGRVAEGERER